MTQPGNAPPAPPVDEELLNALDAYEEPGDLPPGYCQEAWDYVQSIYSDPMSAGAPVGEIVEAYEQRHIRRCAVCRERLILEAMP